MNDGGMEERKQIKTWETDVAWLKIEWRLVHLQLRIEAYFCADLTYYVNEKQLRKKKQQQQQQKNTEKVEGVVVLHRTHRFPS